MGQMTHFLLAGCCLAGLWSGMTDSAWAEEAKPAVLAAYPHEVSDRLQQELQPGSLIAHRGDCLAVRIYTQSSVTHVGLLLPCEQGGWLVYDSANGEGVRKTPLEEYLEGCLPDEVSFYHPVHPLTENQTVGLRTALEQHLGRPYSISHFVSGKSAEGLHCSEYVTRSLMAIDLLRAERPPRVSPASLLVGIEQGELYEQGSSVQIREDVIPAPPVGNWYQRMWSQTQTCSTDCYKKVSRMVLCCD